MRIVVVAFGVLITAVGVAVLALVPRANSTTRATIALAGSASGSITVKWFVPAMSS